MMMLWSTSALIDCGCTWQNNQRWIPQDIGRIKVDTERGRIEFNPVHRSDEAVYTCVAINDVGSDNSSALVTVLGMKTFIHQKSIR